MLADTIRRVHYIFGVKIMIYVRENNIVPDKTTIADLNSALILKVTARIYKHVFSENSIFSEIGIKQRKKTKSIIDFFAGKLRRYFTDLGGYDIDYSISL